MKKYEDDEIVMEIRKFRSEHARALGFDVDRIFEGLKKRQKANRAKKVSFASKGRKPMPLGKNT
ncbi:MAG: hypothetical protein NUW37_17310 [Planctomycetes bacterium]|nr:hypothetical protein [Planctomycetota bacterium]